VYNGPSFGDFMSALENIEYSLAKINGMLEQDWMTIPVRQILNECKSSLEAAKIELGG
tara:strand:+ start:748 stop:921 length:174 start_codon:yes stop_codon:yes gene_type:complete